MEKTRAGQKRKRTSGVSIAAQQAVPASSYKTYRVQGIPATYTRSSTTRVLNSILNLKKKNQGITIHSFAPNPHEAIENASKVATFTLAVDSKRLEGTVREWTFTIPEIGQYDDDVQPNMIKITIDSHFEGMTPLNAFDNGEHHCIDCVAITGLAGHAFGSFKERGGEHMWLRDSLPRDAPGVRVLTYGYNSALVRSNTFQGIEAIASAFVSSLGYVRQVSNDVKTPRPLIFIAHSLGGLVLKQALIQMKDGDAISMSNFNATCGALLFGVPNRGLREDCLEPMVKGQPNALLVSNLSPESDYLRQLHRNFCSTFTFTDSRIISCYETELSPTVVQDEQGTWSLDGKHVRLVDQSSATDSLPCEPLKHTLAIHRNHSQMVKFSIHDANYYNIMNHLKPLMNDAVGLIRARFTAEADHSTLQISLSNEEIKCLRSLLFQQYRKRIENIAEPGQETCKWILEHEKFRNWISTRQSEILIVSGKPGCGKSVLAKQMEKWLPKDLDVGNRYQVASFFFHGRGDAIEQSASGMMRALLYEIINGRQELFDEISLMTEYNTLSQERKTEDVIWPLHTIQELFLSLQNIKTEYTFYLIIDSLDEAESSTVNSKTSVARVVELLQQLVSLNSTCKFKIFLTSRPSTISQEFGHSSHPRIALESTDAQYVRKDVDTYIFSQVSPYLKTHISKPGPILEKLRERSNGVFLWVDLVMKQLKTDIKYGEGNKALLQKIDSLQGGMEELYRNILGRLEPERREFRRILLQWVLFAERPLTLVEFGIAINLNRDLGCYSPEEDLMDDLGLHQFKFQIESYCGGLVEISPSKVLGGANSHSRLEVGPVAKYTVQLVHQSAKDFLLRNASEWFAPRSTGYPDWELAHSELAKTCLIYLCFDSFLEGPIRNTELPWGPAYIDYIQHHHLLRYAALYWLKHLDMAPHAIDALWHLVGQLTEAAPKALLSYQVSRVERHVHFSEPVELVHIVCELGYQVILDQLVINITIKADTRDGEGRTPLSLAAEAGHFLICKCLIEEYGVNPNIEDTGRRTAPSWAAREGRTALSWAAEKGHEDVVRLLLDYSDIKPDSEDEKCRTPLSWAAQTGQKAIVKLLLDRKDVRPDSREILGFTPLSYAAQSGNVAIVGLLLDNDGVNMGNRAYRLSTPLSLAAKNGHVETVRLLIDRGAGLEPKDEDGRTPLSLAARYGRVKTVRLLIGRGADLEPKDRYGRTPLSLAADTGRAETVKLLIERGASFEVKDKEGRTSLSLAAQDGDVETVGILVGQGASLESKHQEGRTPLSFASEYARNKVVGLLLERGAEVDSKDGHGRTPLSWATTIIEENRYFIEELFPEGQDLPTYFLHRELGKLETVKILIGKGAQVKSTDVDGQTPLSRAIESETIFNNVQGLGARAVVKEFEDIRMLLLEHGAV